MKTEHLNAIENAVKAVLGKKKINHFYFVACGGSLAFMMPASFIFTREIDIPASYHPANEFVHMQPKSLGPDSVVITCSHSGTTPETVKATEYARSLGATTIALTHLEDSPLWKAAEYPLHYDWGKEADSSDLNKGILYSLIFHILDGISPSEKYKKGIKSIYGLDTAMKKVREQFKDVTAQWGKKYKRESLIYTMGSGASYGEAYSFSICLLMEMQWINSSCIHSGEYFHGPFETTDKQLPMVLIMSEGRTRALDERCLKFLKTYAENYIVIDFKELNKGRIDPAVAEFFNPVVLIPIERYYVSQMAEVRGHSMDVRRYMWKVEY